MASQTPVYSPRPLATALEIYCIARETSPQVGSAPFVHMAVLLDPPLVNVLAVLAWEALTKNQTTISSQNWGTPGLE